MRYILIYGCLSGLVIILTIMAGVLFAKGSFFNSEVFGYLVMLVALSFIFAGVKRYRDIERGGVIGFGRALAIGLASRSSRRSSMSASGRSISRARTTRSWASTRPP